MIYSLLYCMTRYVQYINILILQSKKPIIIYTISIEKETTIDGAFPPFLCTCTYNLTFYIPNLHPCRTKPILSFCFIIYLYIHKHNIKKNLKTNKYYDLFFLYSNPVSYKNPEQHHHHTYTLLKTLFKTNSLINYFNVNE